MDGHLTDDCALAFAGGSWKDTLLKPSRSDCLVDAELRDNLSVLIMPTLRERQGFIRDTYAVVVRYFGQVEAPTGT